jgi:hypothetical protein
MCELCSNPEVGRKAAIHMAESLESLAADYRRMARAELDPHSEKIRPTAANAKALVRKLVEEWV